MKTKETESIFIKLYFYCNRGSALLNSFHTLGLLILGVFYTLKFHNPFWLACMGIGGLIFLSAMGWYAVNRIDRPSEKLSVSRGTHYQISQYALIEETRDLSKKQVELLEKLITLYEHSNRNTLS